MDLNKVMLIGRLARDPETRFTQGGQQVTTLTVATTRTWRDRQSEENKEATEWNRVVLWGRLAEIAGQYLSKGRQCYIEGDLRTNSWERDGVRHYRTEINASELIMLGGQGERTGRDGEQTGGYSSGPPPQGASQRDVRRRSEPAAKQPQQPVVDDDDIDDDIPF